MELILASTSPARRAILQKLQIPFSARAPAVDETPLPGETAQDLVQRLAALKAAAIDASPTAYVIGSDQVASFNGRIIGKPHTRERARAQLADFSGQSITFYTGLCLRQGTTSRVHLEPFTVHFRELTRAEIDHYLDREDVLNCAGSIKSEGLAVHLFRALEGRDPNALMGLPVIALGELLRAAGVSIWDFYPQR